MNIVTTIEGVITLTKQILKADNTAAEGRDSYLKSLVKATQKELKAPERTRGRSIRLDEAGIKLQLAALTTVHDKFYEAVLQACSENLPGTSARAKELNRRSNFARTAVYTARNWIRSGRDIAGLVAEKVTKGNMTVKREKSPLTPRRLVNRVERGITELIQTATELATKDKDAAVRQLESALAQISSSLAALGVSATRDPAQALEQRRPLRTRQGVFFPIGSPLGLTS